MPDNDLYPKTPGHSFGRVLGALAACRGDELGAVEFLKSRGHFIEAAIIEKAAITPNDSTLLDNGLGPVAFDLAAYLRPRTLIGRLPFLPAPFRTRVVRQTTPVAAAWKQEGQPIPFRASAFSAGETIEPLTVASGILLTQELARSQARGAMDMLLNDATAGIRYVLDETLMDPMNGGIAGVRPAAITSIAAGATHIELTQTTVADLDAAMRDALDVLTAAGCTFESARWITHPRVAAWLATVRGNGDQLAYPTIPAAGAPQLAGIPLEVTPACLVAGSPSEFTLTLAECGEILLADDRGAQIEVSSYVAVQADDAPASGAANMVSAWQNGMAALKLTRMVNWVSRRPGAVATILNLSL